MTTPQHFLVYQSEGGTTRVDVRLQEQSLWLSQKQLTELFGKAKGMLSEHINTLLKMRSLRKVQLFGFTEHLSTHRILD